MPQRQKRATFVGPLLEKNDLVAGVVLLNVTGCEKKNRFLLIEIFERVFNS